MTTNLVVPLDLRKKFLDDAIGNQQSSCGKAVHAYHQMQLLITA